MKETARLTKAAKNLLEIEYRLIKRYLGYAVTNAAVDKNPGNGGTLTDLDYTEYTAAASIEEVITQEHIIAGMTAGNDDLSETSISTSASVDAKAKDWVLALRLVYGFTAGNTSGDGDGADVDSQEFAIAQTGTTGAADWSTDATAAIEALKAYLDVYNA